MFRRDTLTSHAFVCRALLAASLLLRLCTACTGVARAEPLSGRVAAVPAGDTLDVQLVNQPGTRLVRLHGVECPASPRALKETAARFTARLALGTEVQVGARGAGPDGALWAEVTLAAPPPPAGTPRSLNVALVEAGLARWSRTYAPERLDLRDAQARASAARRGLWGAPDGSNVTLPPPRVSPPPAARPASSAAASPAPVGTLSTQVSTVSLPRTPFSLMRAAAPFLAVGLIGFAVTLGAFVLGDLRRGGAVGAYRVSPGRRLVARIGVAAAGGVASALLAALPRALLLPGGSGSIAPPPVAAAAVAFAAGALALLAGVPAARGLADLAAARRWARAPLLDPARAPDVPAFGRVHGIARAARQGERARSRAVESVRGLWLREVGSRYGLGGPRGAAAAAPPPPPGRRPHRRRHRRGALQWSELIRETEAVDFVVYSDAGDGTGAALVPAAADPERPPVGFPCVVARYYNETPVRRWLATPYEGDTRVEIQLIPESARVTVWGVLTPPAEPGGLPAVAPDPVTGRLVIADDATPVQVGHQERRRGTVYLGIAALLAVGALCLSLAGGPGARAAVLSAAGALLLGALLRAVRRAAATATAGAGFAAPSVPRILRDAVG